MSPDGSTTVHIYTQEIHRTTLITTNLEQCGPCPVFASFTLAFVLQLRKKHGKTLVRLRKSSVKVQYAYYQKHPHITKPSKAHTLQNPLTHPHAHTHTRLTTEEKAQKNLSKVKKNLYQSTVCILPKTPTHYKTLTSTHITKQYKTTTAQIKTNCI